MILSRDPNLARQHPADYVNGAEITIKKALAAAKKTVRGFKPEQVIGIGVDTTGSTPLPVDANGQPLAFQKKFAKNPAAMAWLWKDHTGVAEAAEITALARKIRPQYLAKCGGIYSSEWFCSKILHCLRTAPEVFDAAHSWVELADYVPAALTGTEAPDKFTAGICAAGHKAMYNETGAVIRTRNFCRNSIPNSARLRERLCSAGPRGGPRRGRIDRGVGEENRFDGGHSRRGRRVRRASGRGRLRRGAGHAGQNHRHQHLRHRGLRRNTEKLADIPGLCGIVNGSVLPGFYGLEAGQSAVGDIFNWLVNYIQPGGKKPLSHARPGRGGAETCSPANAACSRWTGTTATAPSWWTSG